MNAEDEDRAIEQVAERLRERFPAIPLDYVTAIVDEEHRKLDGNPIRDFIPVLVEHEARDRLRTEGATSVLVLPAAVNESPANLARAG